MESNNEKNLLKTTKKVFIFNKNRFNSIHNNEKYKNLNQYNENSKLKNSIDFLSSINFKNYSSFYKRNNLDNFVSLRNNLPNSTSKYKYPLSVDTWDEKELLSINRVVMSNRFTFGEKVKEFESSFAKHIGSKYAVMVNSGSSANLLMIASLILDKNINLNRGDEVIVPALSWATTYFPLHQYDLNIRFVDINKDTLNLDEEKVSQAITKKTKAIFAVNVLGNPNNFETLKKICKKYKLILIEDNCESLGAKIQNKYCGTFGLMGTFSFYFSHHIHTIEGGMITTNNKSLYHHCLSLRSHGWVRDLPRDNKLYKKNKNKFKDSFVFILPGYNLRPNEINGSTGLEQLKKLKHIIKQRRINAKYFKKIFKNVDYIRMQKEIGISSWFGFSIMLKKHLSNRREEVLNILEKNGIETRPIISGDFTKNPVINLMKSSIHGSLTNVKNIDKNGFFIGNNHINLKSQLDFFKKIISKIN